jgi:hypothetical protein
MLYIVAEPLSVFPLPDKLVSKYLGCVPFGVKSEDKF